MKPVPTYSRLSGYKALTRTGQQGASAPAFCPHPLGFSACPGLSSSAQDLCTKRASWLDIGQAHCLQNCPQDLQGFLALHSLRRCWVPGALGMDTMLLQKVPRVNM